MSLILQHFYRHFWNDEICQNIFLLHKELLLEKNPLDFGLTDYYLQRITISNSPITKKEAEEKLIFRQDNTLTSLINKIRKSKDKYLNEEKFQSYLKKRFGRAIDLAKKQIEEKELVEFLFDIWEEITQDGGLLKLLKEYKVVPESIENEEHLNKFVRDEIVKDTKEFLRNQSFSQMFISIDDISNFYNSILKESLLNGSQQNSSVLVDKDNFKSRLKLYDSLFEIGILEGGKFKSYIECTYCAPDTYNGYMTCNIPPRMLKFKCPVCEKSANYMVPYFLIDELYEHIIHPDGVLFFAIEYLLNLYKVDYTKNINFEDCNEIDFILKKGNIVTAFLEVKMFRNDRNEDVKIDNIMSSISQIKKNKEKLLSKGKDYLKTPIFLITNIDEKHIINAAKDKLREDLRDYTVDIFTPLEFYEFLLNKLRRAN